MLNFGSKNQEPFEDVSINIASIIDCFTVLILYLLLSASFVAYGTLDVGVAELQTSASASAAAERNPIGVDVQLMASHQIQIKSAQTTEILSANDGTWDLAALKIRLDQMKSGANPVEAAWISAEPQVEYQHVVRTVQAVGRSIASVNLGRSQ